MHLGDGINFVEDSVAANHSASNGSASNAIKILVIDVDSSDLRYWLFSCLPLPSYCHSFTKQFILSRLWLEANGCSHSSGLSCPPENFVEDPFLQKAKELLSEGGLFIINLVSRSSSVREMVVSRLKAVRCVMPLWFPLHRTPKISKRKTAL